jgi:saccharopine dehydrogenase (NAD+, L-lysine-forming)
MKELPIKYNSLIETGFYVSGFNWFVDYLVFPFAMVTLKIFGKPALNLVGKVFVKGLKWFTKPPYGIILKLHAEGTINGERRKFEINLIHEDGYLMTAVPIVAFLKQYLNSNIKKSGVWYQANIVEPEQFFEDIRSMGIKIEESFID